MIQTDGSLFGTLSAEDLGADPIRGFERWLEEAEAESSIRYPNAVILSTLREDGVVDGRVVLLKGVDERGFTFFTNYRSSKGRALKANPVGALTFYWDPMGRQVRVRGRVERLPGEESDAYFATRPRDSQIGAWASAQSETLASREALLERVRALDEDHRGRAVPRPEQWGGFLLVPDEIEFWQEGAFRLHDRFLFERSGVEGWSVRRLSP